MITLPGEIPNLLQPQSYVLAAGEPGVIVWLDGERAQVAGDGFMAEFPIEDLLLLLDNDTSRHHARLWLSHQARGFPRLDEKFERDVDPFDSESMHPLFVMTRRFRPGQPCTMVVQAHRFGGAAIRLDQGAPVGQWPNDQDAHQFCHVEIALGLEPTDPTELADGSSWVEAQALRQVVLQVLEKMKP